MPAEVNVVVKCNRRRVKLLSTGLCHCVMQNIIYDNSTRQMKASIQPVLAGNRQAKITFDRFMS